MTMNNFLLHTGGLLPSMLATVCMWMMAAAESLVTEDLVMENLERISVDDQVLSL